MGERGRGSGRKENTGLQQVRGGRRNRLAATGVEFRWKESRLAPQQVGVPNTLVNRAKVSKIRRKNGGGPLAVGSPALFSKRKSWSLNKVWRRGHAAKCGLEVGSVSPWTGSVQRGVLRAPLHNAPVPGGKVKRINHLRRPTVVQSSGRGFAQRSLMPQPARS